MHLDNRTLLALLNGIARHDYYEESDITDEFLHTNLCNELPLEEFQAILTKFRGLVRNIASLDMNLNQLDVFLTSQTKKKNGITEEESRVVAKFWKNHKVKIHESVVSRSTYNDKLKNLSWRIDMKTSSSTDEAHAATAIVEMNIQSQDKTQNSCDQLKFEVDDKTMNMVLKNMHSIEEKLKSSSAE